MKNIRNHFPILTTKVKGNPLVYLDNAATTHKPQAVIDALVNFYTTTNANVHRGIYHTSEQASELYESTRAQVARFIGARSSSEIVFTRGTTESINCIAATWASATIRAGDEIVVTQLEHHANLLPWQRLAQEKGATLKFIPVLPDGTLDLSVVPQLLNKKTKLVALAHVSNVLGTLNDIEYVIARAHAVGAKVLVDAAQSIAHQRIDLQKLSADFLVFSGHKVFGPTGVGVLYIAQELHEQIPPYQVGGGMVYQVTYESASWRPLPHRLEAGTPPIAEVVGLGAALEFMQTHVNYATLQIYEAQMITTLIDALESMPRIRLLGPLDQLRVHGHMISFVVDGIHAHDVAAYLDQYGICVRAGHHCAQPLAQQLGYISCVRVSVSAYNTLSEIEQLIQALEQLVS